MKNLFLHFVLLSFLVFSQGHIDGVYKPSNKELNDFFTSYRLNASEVKYLLNEIENPCTEPYSKGKFYVLKSITPEGNTTIEVRKCIGN